MNVKNKIRLVIDVNLWISLLIGKGIKARFEKLVIDNRFEIIVSDELIREFINVSKYKKLQKYIDPEQALALAESMRNNLTVINPTISIIASSDPKDNYLLSLSVQTKAIFLVTGDKPHLLSLKKIEDTNIIKFSVFCSLYNI